MGRFTRWLTVAMGIGLATPGWAAPDPGEAGTVSAAVATAVQRALATRDGAVSCDALFALGADAAVRDALIEAVDGEPPSPWAPTLAARCLTGRVESDPKAAAAVRGWLADARRPGLALAVLAGSGALSPSAARAWSIETLQGQTHPAFRRHAAVVLAHHPHPAVRSLRSRLQGGSIE